MLKRDAIDALSAFRPDLVPLVRTQLTRRQEQAVAAWERSESLEAVAKELGIGESATQQHLSLAGVLRGQGSHRRRQAVKLLRRRKSVKEIASTLGRMHPVTLELAVMDLAYLLLEEKRGRI